MMEGYQGETVVEHSEPKEELAMEFISRYGYIDGSHHKQWVLDQVARILMGTPVIKKEAKWDNGRVEQRYTTGNPSAKYLAWIGDEIDDDEAIGIAP
jgi:hypothetical protein